MVTAMRTWGEQVAVVMTTPGHHALSWTLEHGMLTPGDLLLGRLVQVYRQQYPDPLLAQRHLDYVLYQAIRGTPPQAQLRWTVLPTAEARRVRVTGSQVISRVTAASSPAFTDRIAAAETLADPARAQEYANRAEHVERTIRRVVTLLFALTLRRRGGCQVAER